MNSALKIIFTDDDEDDHFIFKKVLEEIPVHTNLRCLNNGQALMQYLLQHTERLPDVIFLDLNMPRKNGPDCLIEIKGNDKLKHIPVVIYSTAFHKDILDLLYKHGAFHCIRKSAFAEETKKPIEIVLKAILDKKCFQPAREKLALGFVEI